MRRMGGNSYRNSQKPLAMVYPDATSDDDFTQSEGKRHSKCLQKLRDAVLELASSKQAHPLSEAQTLQIEAYIQKIFPTPYVPDHPPYSEMIYRAISKLNEEGGSDKDAISNYIRSHYQDLPWAHDAFLSHHLEELTEGEEIVLARDSRYLLREAGIQRPEEIDDINVPLVATAEEAEEPNQLSLEEQPQPKPPRRRRRPPKNKVDVDLVVKEAETPSRKTRMRQRRKRNDEKSHGILDKQSGLDETGSPKEDID